MDDYNMPMLAEARDEYSIRLINILTPTVIEGFRSIFEEARDLCKDNEEESKYLMTFQNFLARIPKWNQVIIDGETARIVAKSACNYLEDLLTCVHITQLKTLTSIRVAPRQKKIDLVVPKLCSFIHKIYIKAARKLYTNVYLFETDVPALQKQKNSREVEVIVRETIMNVVRDSMPVEQILRAYMDETTEEELVEEKTITPPSDGNQLTPTPPKPSLVQTAISAQAATPTVVPTIVHQPPMVSGDSVVATPSPQGEPQNAGTVTDITGKLGPPGAAGDVQPTILPVSLGKQRTEPVVAGQSLVVATEPSTPPQKTAMDISRPHQGERRSHLDFNNNDQVVKFAADRAPSMLERSVEVEAPKTIERLEQISKVRYEERAAEEEDDSDMPAKVSIGAALPLQGLDVLDVEVLA